MAVQEGLTSIRVSWSPPTPLGDTTGYRIYYNDSGSVYVSGGPTNNYAYLLTGLQNGDSYTIHIGATSEHFFTDNIRVATVTLGESVYIIITLHVSMDMIQVAIEHEYCVSIHSWSCAGL